MGVGASVKGLLWLLMASLVDSVVSVVTIDNNGYRGIVVSIADGVTEDRELINNTQDMFRSGSTYLHTATRERAYFSEVTIVVPSHWAPHPEYNTVSSGSIFSHAEIRIDVENPLYGDAPYTLQPGGCGDTGLYIHFTPSYVKHLHQKSRDMFGPPGKTLVHEWAHLRYGVYDEYATQGRQTSPFYIGEDLQIHVTGCSDDIVGWLRTPQGQACSLNDAGLPDVNCDFYPDVTSGRNNHIRGSIMNLHYLDHVDTFCDDSDKVTHNPVAPNMHNIFCQGRSTWDVISSHPDFANLRNLPRKVSDTEPLFRVVQPGVGDRGRYILLLDRSASMSTNRMRRLRSAASRFILDQVPNGGQIAIITFSNSSQQIYPLTTMNPSNRKRIVSEIPKLATKYGRTAIGEALLHAVQVLRSSVSRSEGAVVILITDGEENARPFIRDVIGQLQEAKVQVNTIAIGDSASVQLEELTIVTGGKSYYFPDDPTHSHSSFTLDSAFFDCVTYQADSKTQPVQLLSRVHSINSTASYEGSFVIDSEVGQNAKFTFTSLLTSPVKFNFEVVLLTPTKDEIGYWHEDMHRKESITRSIVFTLPHAQPGIWKYIMKNSEEFTEIISVTVTAEPSGISAEPVRIRSWINGVNLTYPAYAKVYAQVTKGYRPVLRAHVVAEVDRPGGDVAHLDLYDNGRGADNLPDDGIYSAYFTAFTADGRYGVVAYVSRMENTAVLNGTSNDLQRLSGSTVSEANSKKTIPVAESDLPLSSAEFAPTDLKSFDPKNKPSASSFVEQPVERFERTSLGGTFQVHGYDPGVDRLPPNRITDLEVVGKSLEDRTVTLEWTSPGDDLDSGTADSLEMRFHETSRIFRNFELGYLVNESHVVRGSLTPMPGGHRHRVVVQVPDKTPEELQGRVLFFVIKTRDEAGNEADMSNVGTAYFPINVRQSMTSDSLSGIIVLAVLGVVISIISVLVLVVKCMHWRKKRKLSRSLDM